ncbi:MAG: YraN family protein [Trueperaceae bacterium]
MDRDDSLPPRHWAEAVARRHLERRGWRCLARDAVVPGGELDLVMLDGRTVVVVEVRQRTGARYGTPAETIHRGKRRRLRRSARAWVHRHGRALRLPDLPRMRIDAVLVEGGPRRHRLRHLEDVA